MSISRALPSGKLTENEMEQTNADADTGNARYAEIYTPRPLQLPCHTIFLTITRNKTWREERYINRIRLGGSWGCSLCHVFLLKFNTNKIKKIRRQTQNKKNWRQAQDVSLNRGLLKLTDALRCTKQHTVRTARRHQSDNPQGYKTLTEPQIMHGTTWLYCLTGM
jgi:hypothetical protein